LAGLGEWQNRGDGKLPGSPSAANLHRYLLRSSDDRDGSRDADRNRSKSPKIFVFPVGKSFSSKIEDLRADRGAIFLYTLYKG